MGRFCNHLIFLVLIAALVLNVPVAADLAGPTAAIPESYFGLHIHHLDSVPPTPWPSMAVPEWRLWDAGVNWPDLEPNKGHWQFERLDRYISLAQEHGVGLLLPLGGSPSWASARPEVLSNYSPGFTAEPTHIEDWRTYVTTVVTRYKGRIQAYEIWNEPNLKNFWTGTTEQMVTLTNEAAKIIHSVDPHAIVVSPSPTTGFGLPWFSEFLQAGGAQFVDVIGYHLYPDSASTTPEELVTLVQRIRRVMADHSLGNLPLWNTESGWLKPARFDSDELAAAFLARAYILAWVAGVERFYWYAWDNRSMAIVTYNEENHMPTPAGYAYQIMEQWLVGARMNRCTESADHTWTCELNRSGKKEWIVWNTQGSMTFDPPAAWRVRSVTPLLHDRHLVDGPRIGIGPVPMLLTGRS